MIIIIIERETNNRKEKTMDLVIVILGIMYLCGMSVGKALAICSIIEGLLVLIVEISRKTEEKKKKDKFYTILKNINKD